MKHKIGAAIVCLILIVGLTCGCQNTLSETELSAGGEPSSETTVEAGGTIQEETSEPVTEAVEAISDIETEEPEIIEVDESEPETDEPETDQENANYLRLYTEILDNFYEFVFDETNWSRPEPVEIALQGTIYGTDPSEALSLIGYALKDVSGDGIPELIIAPTDIEKPDDYLRGRLYAIYTLKDDDPFFSNFGSDYHSIFFVSEGLFYYQGIAGATAEIFRHETVSLDGTEFTLSSEYLSKIKEPPFEKWDYYINTASADSPTGYIGEEIDEEAFLNLVDEMVQQVEVIELTPFSEYEPVRMMQDVTRPMSIINLAEKAHPNKRHTFNIDDIEHDLRVVLRASGNVIDFKVLELTPVGNTNVPVLTFETKELYSRDELVLEWPLILGIPSIGEFPEYGVSFIDHDGILHHYAINRSKNDGSIQLVRFNKK